MRLLLIIAVMAALVSGTGCYRTYTGFYYLPEWTVDRASPNRTLLKTVEEAIQPFGFERVEAYLEPDTVLYVNKRELRGLHEPARVRVVVDTRRPSVLVGDLDHDYETPFVRSVKDSIEKGLKARFGLTELKFVRHIDLFE